MNLPKTDFPMRANLPQSEPERLKKWEGEHIYQQVLEKNKDGKPFVLHDGPPYANGPIHLGHSLNKVLKDIIVKYHSSIGEYSPYVPGWDCHGLPIENKVEEQLGPQKMKEIDTPTFRKICREYANKQLEGQRRGFKRLGVNGEWDNPYLTFLPEYEAGNIEVFKKLYLDGSIYRGRKPIHWCSHCHTALAEAEIEYTDEVSPSIYVKFYFTEMPHVLAASAAENGFDSAKSGVVIWTTTPWTLPANQAVSLSPSADYVVACVDGELLVVADELSESLAKVAGWGSVEYLTSNGEKLVFKGDELKGALYTHPVLEGEQGVVLTGDHVTLDTGTGAVHTAPGHGVDDYLVCRANGIEDVRMPVDDDGKFYEGSCPWGGKDAAGSNAEIIEWLGQRGTLVARQDISHSYPHCWRCKQPVIFRATTQWFVSMDKTGLRKAALDQIEHNVQWVPEWASHRIGSMVADRPDWCISRQRFWGVPIPVFECADCGEIVANEESFDAVIELFKTKGADAWYYTEASDMLPETVVCPNCGGRHLNKGSDVLDVWWESGVSHTSVCEARPYLHRPADVYLEGSDQHRGWFQSSLLTSVGAYGIAPYKTVISCGFTVDQDGRKMSKSLGNVIDPNVVCNKLGADVLRLWVASVDSSVDMSISDDILQQVSDTYRRFRNTFRFLLGNLDDFDSEKDAIKNFDELEPIDQYMMAKTYRLLTEVQEGYDSYRFNTVYRAAYDFVTDLSSVYMDVTKDRLYSEAPNSPRRRCVQTVLFTILEVLVRVLSPVLSFTTDEVWGFYPPAERQREGRVSNVQLVGWPSLDTFKPALPADFGAAAYDAFLPAIEAREVATKALEDARAAKQINKSQEAQVRLTVPAQCFSALTALDACVLEELFIVSGVTLVKGQEFDAEVLPAQGEKCPRCWNYRSLVSDGAHAGVCERCADALGQIGFAE